MTWDLAIALIIKYGPDGAHALWKVATEFDAPSQEAWEKILALGLKPYDVYIAEARARAARAALGGS